MRRIKKLLLTICLALLIAPVVPSLAPRANLLSTVHAASRISISKKKLKLRVGKTKTIRLKGLTKAQAKKVRWSSSKKSVATVKKGKIRALKPGKATITAKYKGKKYKCKLTVSRRSVKTASSIRSTSGSSSGSSGSGNSSGSGGAAGTVYWTPSGSVYHTNSSCSTLSRSRTILNGSISDSGKPRACKVCS